MKFFSLISGLLLITGYSFAQYDYGYGNDKEHIQKAGVRSLSIYYFTTESDSILTHVNTYDRHGCRVSTRMLGSDGIVSRADTFIYDSNHLLSRQIAFSNGRLYYESVFTYNPSGKLLTQRVQGDSVNYYTGIVYDEAGRSLTSTGYDNRSADTTVVQSFFDENDLLIKSIVSSKQTGTSVYTRNYNARGKLVKIRRVDSGNGSQQLTTYNYNKKGENDEVINTITSKKQKTVNKTFYTRYPDGLSFEKTGYMNNKPLGVERTYYSYY
ncbi:MAG TPA: hypothetical protein PLZ45_07090 [Ferruginibacter sp.]|nr:hypothetical protein [Ferruginibacter sp.]